MRRAVPTLALAIALLAATCARAFAQDAGPHASEPAPRPEPEPEPEP